MINDLIHQWVDPVMASAWVYLALFLLSWLDAFFPIVPSESIVISAGVFAAAGSPNLLLVMLIAAAGAWLGDNTSYLIGRFANDKLGHWLWRSPKRKKAFDWASRALESRGGLMIVVARYIPGGRTAVTLTAGAVRFRHAKFAFFSGIAALTWGVYSGLVGYLGGKAFEDDTLKGLLTGLGMAIGVSIVIEVSRWVVHRIQRRRAGHAPEPAEGTEGTGDADGTAALDSAAEPGESTGSPSERTATTD